MPKAGEKRRRTMIGYEKGLIWGNDNYRTNGALVNIALATGNVGRAGGGVVRLGGHREGYVRPSDAHVGRPAAYVDELLIEGRGGMVKDAMNTVPWGDRDAMVAAIMTAVRQGACSPSTSTSFRPRSARRATSGCRPPSPTR